MKPEQWPGRWAGRTAVCIASGPSLTEEDCETVHASGLPTIVTNTTFKRCPWADALMAFDGKWWDQYAGEVVAAFKGERFGCSKGVTKWGVPNLELQRWFRHFFNSGATAVSLAVAAGASTVVLLGFDCQKTGGRTHWHGSHPSVLRNATTMGNWPTQFKGLARYCKERNVRVINASRETALKCFERMPLDVALLEVACHA